MAEPRRTRIGKSLRHAWNAFVSDRETQSFAKQNQYSRFYGQSSGRSSGSVSLDVGGPDCEWTAASQDDWIVLTSAGTGTGNSTITFNVLPNPGPDRSGTIQIAGSTLTIT